MATIEEGRNGLEDSRKTESGGITVDDNSASFNIARSRQLIRTLEQTAQNSVNIVNKARAFNEMYQMLDVSKKMSANSKAQVRWARRLKSSQNL